MGTMIDLILSGTSATLDYTFTTRNDAGELTNSSTTPTVTLRLNGTLTAQTATVTNVGTGRYRAVATFTSITPTSRTALEIGNVTLSTLRPTWVVNCTVREVMRGADYTDLIVVANNELPEGNYRHRSMTMLSGFMFYLTQSGGRIVIDTSLLRTSTLVLADIATNPCTMSISSQRCEIGAIGDTQGAALSLSIDTRQYVGSIANITAGAVYTITNAVITGAVSCSAGTINLIDCVVIGNVTQSAAGIIRMIGSSQVTGTRTGTITTLATRAVTHEGLVIQRASDSTTQYDEITATLGAISAKVAPLPAQPAAVGSAMTLANNAITASTVVTGALNGKGNWLVGANMPANFASMLVDPSGRVTLNPTQMTELISDADIGTIVSAIVASFDQSSDVPVITQATATVDRLKQDAVFMALVADALAAKTAAQSVDGKLTTGRLQRLDNTAQSGELPPNFDSMLITQDGKVTTANPASGGGSNHTAADVAALILATPTNKLATDSQGRVTTSNPGTGGGGIGNVQVTLLPGFFLNQKRNIANSLDLYTGEVGVVTIPVFDSQRVPLDLTGLTLEMRFASRTGTPISTVLNGALTKLNGFVEFTIPAPLTVAVITNGTFTLRDMDNGGEVLVTGKLNVRAAI